MADFTKPSKFPAVLFLYGLAGVGKNFVGDIIGEMTGAYVYHADRDLTAEMKAAIAERRTFTPEMRDRYFEIVADKILDLRNHYPKLVVTQAAYKAKHRQYLRERIAGIELVCISASDQKIYDNLKNRGDKVDSDYASKIRVNFEPPLPGEWILLNESGKEDIVKQVQRRYGLTL